MEAEDEKSCDEACQTAASAPPSQSIYDSPEYLKMQARSAAIAHAIDVAKTNRYAVADQIVKDAEAFAAFLLG